MGPNGSGKSTLTLLVTGVLKPDSGTILVKACSPQSLAAKQLFTCLPEVGFLKLGWSARLNIDILTSLNAAAYGQTVGSLKDRAYELIELFGLDRSELRKPCHALSIGMRRKVEIALCLSVDVPLYVLDIPTAGLDPLARERFSDVVAASKRKGRTFLFSSHVGDELASADRIYFLRNGHVVRSVEPARMTDIARSVVVARFRATEKAIVVAALSGCNANVRDEEFRLCNASLNEVRSRLLTHGVRATEMFETEPRLEDIYSYLTGGHDEQPIVGQAT